MKRAFLNTIVALTIFVPSVFTQAPTDRLAGNWLATLDVGGTKLRLLVKVQRSGDGYAATFDSIDQDARDLKIDTITLAGDKVNFTASPYGIVYEGVLNEKSDEITGTFRQGAGSAPMVFKRTSETPKLERSQNPKKPYPYDEEEVSYRNNTDNIKLTGALTLPRDKTKKYPVVILISGSGSQDRDETVAGHKPFLVLADHLTRSGIAVLRVDDRGTGGSDRGSLSVTTENFVLDVLAGIDYLKTRKDIDAKKIGLIGHSEGGMIAPLAAGRSKDVAFIVLLAGIGQRGEDVIYTQNELIQRAGGTDEGSIAALTALSKEINSIVKAETDGKVIEERVNAAIAGKIAKMNETQRKAFEPTAAAVRASMAIYKTPWYKYFISYDPAGVFAKVKVPVLALNGERDLQVAYKPNLDGIAAGLRAAKNKDVTVRSFPHLNHLFQSSMTGLPSEYQTIEETMSPDVMRTISEWILTRTSARR